jgi:hypothetical protein
VADLDLLAILALVVLVTVVLRGAVHDRRQTGREELARIRLLSDKIQREGARPFE